MARFTEQLHYANYSKHTLLDPLDNIVKKAPLSSPLYRVGIKGTGWLSDLFKASQLWTGVVA